MRSLSPDRHVVRNSLSWTLVLATVILLAQGNSSANGGGGGGHSGPPTKMPSRDRAASPVVVVLPAPQP